MENYRGYIIEPCYSYSDGKSDGMFYLDGDEKATMFHRQTITEVKRDIDEVIWETTWYPVKIEDGTVIKFQWLIDALAFVFKYPDAELQFHFDAP